jgi:fluoride exporter
MGGYLVVFLGGGIGAALRHGVNRAAFGYLGPAFPYGTLFVNVVGSLLMGLLSELFLTRAGVSQEFRLFLTTGLLGGFTTFSAFSLEAGLMWQRGNYGTVAAYSVASVVLSVVALFLGMAFVRAVA